MAKSLVQCIEFAHKQCVLASTLSCEGSESLQLARAAQLPGLLTQQIHQLDNLEVQLREKKEENAQRLLQQYKVVIDDHSHSWREKARLSRILAFHITLFPMHVARSLYLHLLTPTPPFRCLWRHVVCYIVHWSRPD